ncbi:MAG TPA: hypothetical protein VGB20_07120 [bacterium]
MDIEALWDKARKETEIRRMRMSELPTFEAARVPYIFLGPSTVNDGDTVVRRGHVLLERPTLILPSVSPQFEGFEFDRDWQLSEHSVATFLLLRGVQFPSMKYKHQVSSLDVYEAGPDRAAAHYLEQLNRTEDVHTGLVIGPEDAWQFSVLFLIGALVVRSAEGDLRRILEQWRRRQRGEQN